MLERATVLVGIPLPANVTLADDPGATHVALRRGVASTLNTPALDPGLMLDGRQPNLVSQAFGAITDHANGVVTPTQLHDNSAATLEDVAAHYADFFSFVTGGFIQLSAQDQRDIVAFLKLLD